MSGENFVRGLKPCRNLNGLPHDHKTIKDLRFHGSLEAFDQNETEFRNCDFSELADYNSKYVSCVFVNCNFNKMTLCRVVFDRCVFKNCTFETAIIRMVTVTLCYFHNCRMAGLKLGESVLTGSNFISCTGLDKLDRTGVGNHVIDCTGLDKIPMACPKEGEFYGWKVVSLDEVEELCSENGREAALVKLRKLSDDKAIVKLRIPSDAKRLSGIGRKCRCSKAEVVYIKDLHEDVFYGAGYSIHNPKFVYKPGEIVEPEQGRFDENRWDECSSGIHFFMTEEEAVEYATEY